jgi:hypothetical protein
MIDALLLLAAALAGLHLLLGAFGKALDPRFAGQALEGYGLLPERFRVPVAVAAALLEAALGGGVLLGSAAAAWGALALLGAMALLLLRGRARGMAECGCNGALLPLTPAESLALNAAAALLLALFLVGGAPALAPGWAAAVVALLAAGAMAALARHAYRKGPPFDLSPLRVGRAWRPRWVPGLAVPEEAVVVLADPLCATCLNWLRMMAMLSTRPGFPPVRAVVAAPAAALPALAAQHGLKLALHPITPGRLRRLAPMPPRAVRLKGGRIAEVWQGRLPDEVRALLR